MCNVESLYKKLTGLDPRRDIEPPLTGPELLREIQRLKTKPAKPLPSLATIQDVSIFDSGVEGTEQFGYEPFTVLVATLSDGSTAGYWLPQSPPDKHELLKFARNLPKNQWFLVKPDLPASASGI